MTETILGSSLKESFELEHFDTTLNDRLDRIGKFGLKKAFRLWKQYRDFARKLKKEGPDLVLIPLSQTPAGSIKDLRFVRIAHHQAIRTVAHLHGGELDRALERSSKRLRSHAEKGLRKLDAAIVLGNSLRRIFRPYLPEERIFTIPNGLDIAADPGEKPAPPPFRLLFLSNPIRRKGIEDLIDAVSRLVKKEHEFHLDVAGEWFEPWLEKACKDRVEQEKLPIRFHPPLEGASKKALFRDAHLFLLPSREPEGMPVALIEAMAHGLPIISTEQGAIPEMVEHEKNGFLVPVEDPGAIAEKIELLTQDPQKREDMGVCSRERYRSRFTEKSLSENLYHCFSSLLEDSQQG